MNAKALFLTFLVFSLSPLMGQAQAQTNEGADQCEITPTQIITLEDPEFKTPIIAEASYKLAGIDNVIDADFGHVRQNSKEKSYVLLGNYKNTASQSFPFLAHLTHKGQIIWHVHEKSQYPHQAVDLLKNKYGYLVLGNIEQPGKGRGFYVAQYDRNGKRLRRTPFFTPGYNSFAKSIDFTRDKKGYLVAVDRIDSKGKKSATAYQVNIDGFSPWDKKYALDHDTIFENILRLPQTLERGHIVTGSIEKEDGRYAGWLFNLREDGKAGWQKEYVRGVNASLNHTIALDDGGYLVAGHTQSFFGDKRSAWIMKVRANAAPLWQRFYTGNHDYHVRGLRRDENGLISILMEGRAIKNKKQSKAHLRLLTLSPRGDVLYKDSFKGADKLFANQFLKGPSGEHVIIGMKQFIPPANIEEARNIAPINEGWILFSPAFENYTDPCVPTKEQK